MERFLRQTTGVVLTLILSSMCVSAQNSTFTNESDWRAAYKQAQADQSSAEKLKKIGITAAVGGGALAIFGALHQSTACKINGMDCTSTQLADIERIGNAVANQGGVSSYDFGTKRSWALAAGGAGAAALGVVLFRKGENKASTADEWRRQLDSTGKDKGWRISLIPTGVGALARLSYRW